MVVPMIKLKIKQLSVLPIQFPSVSVSAQIYREKSPYSDS